MARNYPNPTWDVALRWIREGKSDADIADGMGPGWTIAGVAALRQAQERANEETARTLMRECGDDRDYF